MAVGQTDLLDGAAAARDLVEQCRPALDNEPPQAALVLAAHDLDHQAFLSAIAGAFGEIELIGCSTIGSMSSANGFSEGSTSLTLFASDVLDFTAGLGEHLGSDERAAVSEAVKGASAASDKEPALAIVMPGVEAADPTVITRELGALLGPDVCVVGGGAAPDLPIAVPWLGGVQLFGDRVLTDSVPVLLVSGPLRISVGVAHGWGAVGRQATVTRAQGNRVFEVDGEPTVNYYQRYLGTRSVPAVSNPLAVIEEGSSEPVLRAPMQYNDEDGSASFFGAIPEGAVVQLAMASTDEILDGVSASVATAMDTFPDTAQPEAAFVASCAVRSFLLGSRTGHEVEHIRSLLADDIPVSGFYAFGEIAPTGPHDPPAFHNETCVTVLLGT